jgi:hypothetical protein
MHLFYQLLFNYLKFKMSFPRYPTSKLALLASESAAVMTPAILPFDLVFRNSNSSNKMARCARRKTELLSTY